MSYYELVFDPYRASLCPEDFEDDGQYLQMFEGKILYSTDMNFLDESLRVQVGTVKAFRINGARALNDGIDIYDECDMGTDTTCRIADTLYDFETRCFKESVQDLLDQAVGDILYVDIIKLDKKYRGQGLGLLALKRSIDLLGNGVAAVGIEPFPMQCKENHTLSDQDIEWFGPLAKQRSLTKARQKLRRYWSRLGFKQFEKSNLFLLCMNCAQPSDYLKGIRTP